MQCRRAPAAGASPTQRPLPSPISPRGVLPGPASATRSPSHEMLGPGQSLAFTTRTRCGAPGSFGHGAAGWQLLRHAPAARECPVGRATSLGAERQNAPRVVSFVAEASSPRVAWATLRWWQKHLVLHFALPSSGRPSLAGLAHRESLRLRWCTSWRQTYKVKARGQGSDALLAAQSMVWGSMRYLSIFVAEHLFFSRCMRGDALLGHLVNPPDGHRRARTWAATPWSFGATRAPNVAGKCST